jgi:hypothetical protein
MYNDAPGNIAVCAARPSQKDFVQEAPLSSSGLSVPYTKKPNAELPASFPRVGEPMRSFKVAEAAVFNATELRLRTVELLFEGAVKPKELLLLEYAGRAASFG